MISNPVNSFVNGNESQEFTYEGGENLWHFSPHGSNLSKTMEMNVIFFANGADHAMEVLERMMKHVLKCEGTPYVALHEEVVARRNRKVNQMAYLLDNKDKWLLQLAPTNQFYKVGWASNDTI